MNQNSRLPEGKPVFSINHRVCKNSLGPVSHSDQLGEVLRQFGELLTSRLPDSGRQALVSRTIPGLLGHLSLARSSSDAL